jgi:hypothetical protein
MPATCVGVVAGSSRAHPGLVADDLGLDRA